MKGPYANLDALEKDHWKFFEPGAMRFFDSRIGRCIYGGRIFTTSEQFHDGHGYSKPRTYKVRIATANGTIETLEEGLNTSSTARRHAEQWAATLAGIIDTVTSQEIRAILGA